jgi:hypothetical protein
MIKLSCDIGYSLLVPLAPRIAYCQFVCGYIRDNLDHIKYINYIIINMISLKTENNSDILAIINRDMQEENDFLHYTGPSLSHQS